MAKVDLRNVRKSYGTLEVIHGIDMQVADGEFVVIVGPSGCGKSTLLRMVAGLEAITSGEIAIGERVVNNLEPKDRDIAMVFQNYALYPHMSVYQNMAYGLRIRGLAKSEIEERVKRAAGILELEPLLLRTPRQLSGGQRQRVAMGRAIVREPAVFLMDEPLSNLDAKLRVQTRAEIARLHQRLGTTTIYVTHDQVEAMTMGDRIAVMRDGILQQVGMPQELYDHPQNIFVAGFIGSPAMNFANTKTDGEDIIMGNTRLRLSGPAAEAAAKRPQGSELLIGFRPEHLDVVDGGSGTFTIPASVDVVEYLGNEELIHAQSEGNEIVAVIPSDRKVKAGAQIELTLPLNRLYVFDPETERALVS